MTKDQLLASMLHEINVAKHLFARLPAGSYDFRPTPGQRSTTELLRYLSYCGIGPARAMLAESAEPIKPLAEAASRMTAAEFPAAMDRQAAALKELFAEVSDDDYENRHIVMPSTNTPPTVQGKLCELLVNRSLKFLAAYRMQLFLYAKMTGAKDLDTWDCWRGIENPARKS